MVRDKLVKLVETEEQMLFIFHLVGPFLQRLHSDRFMRVLFELTVQLYEILLRVDRQVERLQHQDAVCDLLYHIKYQFTGDSVKQDAERVVRQLKPALQLRLRFIAQVGSSCLSNCSTNYVGADQARGNQSCEARSEADDLKVIQGSPWQRGLMAKEN